jgi:hypothetical protein
MPEPITTEYQAYDAWAETDGKETRNHRTLQVPDQLGDCFRDRISKAFHAGCDAGRALERRDIQAKAARMLFGG